MTHYRDISPHSARDKCLLGATRRADYHDAMRMAFRDALLKALEDDGVSLRSVATATGISYEQLKKLKQGKSTSTNVDDAVVIANHFGMSLDEFIGDRTKVVRGEIVELYNALEPSERSLLLAAARGFRAQRQVEEQ